MSRQNKVNPGMYTQRGRLTQDDAARELRKQASIGSQHTWQPVKKNALPRLDPKNRADGTETTEDKGSNEETESAPVKPMAAKAKTMKRKTAQAKTATTGKAKKTAAKSKTGKASKTAAKRSASAPKRKAVLARNVGGGGAAPRPTAKRRKS
jgi:hypothetical protein